MDISTAINRIAERTTENRQLWGQSLRQRRSEFTDIYGIPFRTDEVDNNKTFTFHVSISSDMEYYERFQMQLYVATTVEDAPIDPDLFKIEMTDAETYDTEVADDYIWVDLSEYFIEQKDEWPDSTGYYPAEQQGGDVIDYYDVLDACGMLVAEGHPLLKDMLLQAGNKLIRVSSGTKCNVTLTLFLKYSSVNR